MHCSFVNEFRHNHANHYGTFNFQIRRNNFVVGCLLLIWQFLVSEIIHSSWLSICFHLQPQDVFINVVGGLQLREPAADVAIAVAICSRFVSTLGTCFHLTEQYHCHFIWAHCCVWVIGANFLMHLGIFVHNVNFPSHYTVTRHPVPWSPWGLNWPSQQQVMPVNMIVILHGFST